MNKFNNLQGVISLDKSTGRSFETLWSSGNFQQNNRTEFKIERYRHRLRFFEPMITRRNSLMMFIGEPAKCEVKTEGKTFRRHQHRGTLEINPTGLLVGAELDGNVNDDIYFQFSQEFLEKTAEACDLNPACIEITHRYLDNDPQIEFLLNAFQSAMESNTPISRIYGESLALTIVIYLIENHTNRLPIIKNHSGGLPPLVQRKVLEFIEANLDKNLSLEDLARISGYSTFHFSRMFKAEMKQTPHRFIIGKRIEKAKTLLAKNDLKLAEIALETGFSSQSHFTTVFNKFTGRTPNGFRCKK